MYLVGNIGMVLGVSVGSSVQKWMLKALLVGRERANGMEVRIPLVWIVGAQRVGY